MKKLINIINYISNLSTELKNKHTDEYDAPIEFVCIFCQNDKEFEVYTKSIEKIGKIVERTQSGFSYQLDKPIRTIAGPLRLVKIRKPDPNRPERGDADFNTDYQNFKKHHEGDPKFEFIKREKFEMLRLSHPEFDVMACFSNIPKSKVLGIKL